MRLSSFQQQNILTIAYAIFGDSTLVYLFGSRKDDNKRGGDIDLLLKPAGKINDNELFEKKIKFIVKLKKKIGNRKIDVFIDNGLESKMTFFNEIYKNGIRL